MAIVGTQIGVVETAKLLFQPNNSSLDDPTPAVLVNMNASGGAIVYLGGSAVATTTGCPLYPQVPLSVELFGNDIIYGISATTATTMVGVLMGRQ